MAEKTPYLKLLHLLLLLLHFPFSSSNISLGSILYASGSNQNWPSPNSTFSVSFVPASSPNSFLAAVSFAGTVPIWSAGSVDSRGSLRLLPSGSLRLINGSNTTIWDSGSDRLGVTSASIEDSGNLVLLNNQNIPVWSSFDNPTDTIVQSQNFTVGKVLRSGRYSFQLERSGNLTLRWNSSAIYWNYGSSSSFSSNLSSPSLGLQLQTNGVVSIFDSNLPGVVDIVYNGDYGDRDTFRFLKLDDDGNLRIYSSASRNSGPVTTHWSAVDQCLVYGCCGNFGICSYNDTDLICSCPSLNFDFVDVNDRRKGCKRKLELSNCSGNTTMLDLGHTMLFRYKNDPNSESFFAGSSPCRANCLSSSACLASVSMSDGSGNCWHKQPGSFFSGYRMPTVLSTTYVIVCGPVLLSQPLIETKGNGWKLKLILGVSAASVVMVIILVAIIVRAKKARKSDWNGENVKAVVMLRRYSYAKVKKMTSSFGDVLGRGGFGTVYKGKLPDSRQDVAVKILKESEGNGEEFINEVASMSRTSHVNIVSLLGFCYERSKRAIVYEFMPNGSLDKFLAENMPTNMEWEKLCDIALGVSRGLEYLHNRCVSRIVHFDIKPQNILMDKDLSPKISDFGLAKLCKNNESIMSMLHARGTIGYIAPEVFF